MVMHKFMDQCCEISMKHGLNWLQAQDASGADRAL